MKKKSITGAKKKSIAGGKKKSIAGGKKKSIVGGARKSITGGKKSSHKNDHTPSQNLGESLGKIEPLDPETVMLSLVVISFPPRQAPIDLWLNEATNGLMRNLNYKNFNTKPLYLKLSNTSDTLVLNGSWAKELVPTVSEGPLLNEYIFSQMHFHWGPGIFGSEHRINGTRYALELHVVFYNKKYNTYYLATNENDGIIIFVYVYAVTPNSDPKLDTIIEYLSKIKNPFSQLPIETLPLRRFITPFVNDYFMYYGTTDNTGIVWLIQFDNLEATSQQLEAFRTLMDRTNHCITRNFRDIKPLMDRPVYFITDSRSSFHAKNLRRFTKAVGGRALKTKEKNEEESKPATTKRKSMAGKRKSMGGKRKSLAKKK